MSVATHTSPLSRIPLDEPLGFDSGELSDRELVETMVAARRLASRVQAVELAAVAELARRRFAEAADREAVVEVLSPADYVHDEVAEALTLTSAAADALIRFATELTGRLPATFTALAAGEVDYAKARTLWHGTDQVDAELAQAIEAMVLPRASRQTTGQIRAKTRRLVKRLAPDTAARRREEAERRRGVALFETDDGTAQLSGVDLPADAASAAYGRVSAIATGLKRDGDDRGIDQLRADVFLALLRGTLTPGEPAADTARRPTGMPAPDPGWTAVDDAVADVIAEAARSELTTLTKALDHPRRDIGDLIAETGARINRSVAARHDLPERHHDIGDVIAQAGARISWSLTELRSRWCLPSPGPAPATSGDVGLTSISGAGPATASGAGPAPGGDARFAHGVARYRTPAAMRRLIEHRDRRCCHPGCRRPVRHCDADHSIPFHRGGATCPCNLAMLCRRHHRAKATRGWRVEHLWPGVILWVTPTGHWKITAPADRE